MPGINKRIFGSDIDAKVKAKLELRQAYAESAQPLESINNVITKYSKQGVDISNVLNFQEQQNFGGVADLSSRTPFVRMWTAIEIRTHTINQTESIENIDDHTNENIKDKINKLNEDNSKVYEKKGKKIIVKDVKGYERIVYEVGNHTLNELSDVLNQRQGNELSSINSTDVIPNVFETNNNEFMKPAAGITSITSNTEGALGTIKKTSINFVVHNFHDYDKIYSKYFLRPGAQVFVDFGWDTIKELYKPQELLNDALRSKFFQGKSVEEILFGDKGYVTDTQGDLDIIIGLVSSFDAKVKENGSVECVLELISKNTSIIESEIDDKVKMKLLYALDTEVTKYALEFFTKGKDTAENIIDLELGKSVILTATTLQEYNTKSRAFLAANLTNFNGNFPTIKGTKSGVYWQTIIDKDGNPIAGNSKNIYISFGLLEDAILNTEFGVGGNLTEILGDNKEFGNFEGRFDSSNTYVKFDTNLINRQKSESDATKLSFIYPLDWSDTYNIDVGKTPDNRVSVEDEKNNEKKIPLRELFINLQVIKNAFKTTNNVRESVENILNNMNKDSYEIFDLKITSGDVVNSKLTIIDNNFLNIKGNDEKEFFDNLFIFKPMSRNSIVKSYDLSISTPKGDLQNMIAIQSIPSGKSLFPISSIVDTYLSLNTTNQTEKRRDSVGSDIGVVYLPQIGNYQTDKLDEDLALESSLSNHFQHQFQNKLDEENETNRQYLNNIAEIFSETKDFDKFIPNKEDDSVDKTPEITDDQLEAINTDAQIAGTISEYYGFLAKNTYVDEIPTIIPATLSLSIYGISSLVPGDIFRVDYLPERHRKLVFFQITKVSHNVNSSTWTTQLETVMRIRKTEKKKSGLWREKTDVLLSKTHLSDLNLQEDIKNLKPFITKLKPLVVENRNAIRYIFEFTASEDKLGAIMIKLKMNFPEAYLSGAGTLITNYNIRPNKNYSIYEKAITLPSQYGFQKSEFDFKTIVGPESEAIYTAKIVESNDVDIQTGTGGPILTYEYPIKLKKGNKYKIVVRNSGDFIVFPSDDENHTLDIDKIDIIFNKYNKFLLYKDKGKDLLLSQDQIDKNFEEIGAVPPGQEVY